MLAAFSPSYGVLVGARVVIGLAVGSASMVVPLYSRILLMSAHQQPWAQIVQHVINLVDLRPRNAEDESHPWAVSASITR